MRVWRICKSMHAARAFTGEGAILYAGRWHRRGVPVVYASESRALAALELLVHLHRSRLPPSLVSFAVDVPDDLNVTQIHAKDLPPEWHRHPGPSELQDLGTRWAEARRSVCLQVPSAVVRGEHNFLINPRHPDFDQLRIGKPEPFELDEHLIR